MFEPKQSMDSKFNLSIWRFIGYHKKTEVPEETLRLNNAKMRQIRIQQQMT